MKYTTIVLLLSIAISSYSQHPEINRANIWYFGNGAGLDFSSGSPVAIANGALHTIEGCATMCDIEGDLLMYTDGDTIWDRTHQPMSNGTDLTGCPILGSSAQASLIIAQPGHDSLYYVFTTDCGENSVAFGLRYNVVNMNLNGGLGDVMPAHKNILLYTPSTEGLTATYNCDETGVWIMSHEYNTNNFVCYFLDENGVDTVPIISSVGGDYCDFISYMRFSPNGKKFASYNYCGAFADLFDFDNATGMLQSYISLPNGGYGTCFSNDNSKLYFTYSGNVIYQYDLITNTMNTYTDPDADNSTYLALSNSVNGQIIISSFYQSVSTLLNPNSPVSSTNLAKFNISLDGMESQLGLPDFMQNYFNTSPVEDCDTTINTETIGLPLGFSISPNPAHESVNVVYNGLENATVRLINPIGQIAKKEPLQAKGITMDVSMLPRGIYFMVVSTLNNEYIQKIILL